MKTWLLDTGPLVAVLDHGDPSHGRVTRAFASLRGRLVTTGAVLTEAFYLLRFAASGAERMVDFIEATEIEVADVFALDSLRRVISLMTKYSDQPMDFADASLVVMAEERSHEGIMTLDERGFRAYRFRGKRRFNLVIQDG